MQGGGSIVGKMSLLELARHFGGSVEEECIECLKKEKAKKDCERVQKGLKCPLAEAVEAYLEMEVRLIRASRKI